jgi:L,D-transpeptidase catalytic domain
MSKKAVWRALGLGAAILAAVVAYWVAIGGNATPRGEARPAPARLGQGLSALPKPKRPAFEVGKPVLLQSGATEARYAPVLRDVEARDAPTSAARPVAEVGQMTSDGTTNIVLVIGQARRAGAFWVHVRMPVLPNNETGWVPRRALGGYRFVQTHLVIDREHFAATLYSGRRVVFRAPIGVGRPEAPTPPGEFYVRDKLTDFNDPFYGPVAFGTSARSAVLTDWPGGGFVGIHGTNEPELIPGRISHGCIRLRNEDILRLSRLMPIGTPITVV